jgi:hypothetical protein
MLLSPQEIAQSVRTTPNEAEVTSSNLPSLFLCERVKKKKKKTDVVHITQELIKRWSYHLSISARGSHYLGSKDKTVIFKICKTEITISRGSS